MFFFLSFQIWHTPLHPTVLKLSQSFFFTSPIKFYVSNYFWVRNLITRCKKRKVQLRCLRYNLHWWNLMVQYHPQCKLVYQEPPLLHQMALCPEIQDFVFKCCPEITTAFFPMILTNTRFQSHLIDVKKRWILQQPGLISSDLHFFLLSANQKRTYLTDGFKKWEINAMLREHTFYIKYDKHKGLAPLKITHLTQIATLLRLYISKSYWILGKFEKDFWKIYIFFCQREFFVRKNK